MFELRWFEMRCSTFQWPPQRASMGCIRSSSSMTFISSSLYHSAYQLLVRGPAAFLPLDASISGREWRFAVHSEATSDLISANFLLVMRSPDSVWSAKAMGGRDPLLAPGHALSSSLQSSRFHRTSNGRFAGRSLDLTFTRVRRGMGRGGWSW